ncbi:hypothetical protein OZ411_06940 [Bradyrhizobium sp. Arg237L]|uniref:hypothetical protein n=1 Tax=Bradyrhizobium sp. Arg237L TaxID=3003352 RepID=UPI00249D90DC|nr:hypothetical protein [Bradyrhizobium sp. Arg237L]MDI4232546.1 hypothetical protein [Bradyrhizobium sp. Arg237L]
MARPLLKEGKISVPDVDLFSGEGLHGAKDPPRLVARRGRSEIAFAGIMGSGPGIESLVARTVRAAGPKSNRKRAMAKRQNAVDLLGIRIAEAIVLTLLEEGRKSSTAFEEVEERLVRVHRRLRQRVVRNFVKEVRVLRQADQFLDRIELRELPRLAALVLKDPLIQAEIVDPTGSNRLSAETVLPRRRRRRS